MNVLAIIVLQLLKPSDECQRQLHVVELTRVTQCCIVADAIAIDIIVDLIWLSTGLWHYENILRTLKHKLTLF